MFTRMVMPCTAASCYMDIDNAKPDVCCSFVYVLTFVIDLGVAISTQRAVAVQLAT